ncbi:MAG: HDIG domain-containing protein [Anaerolineae bacterium]|nr:HDIG domain-containing protein [Anaerolineae bacterium]
MRAIWQRYFPSNEEPHRKGAAAWYGRLMVQVLLAVLFLVGATVLVEYDSLSGVQDALSMTVGQVAPQDVTAPFSTNYESEVLTTQKRQVAVDSVRLIYDPPDPSIARQQVQLAREVLDYIADVRADEYATLEMLQADLEAIEAIDLSPDEIRAILAIDPDRWLELDQQVMLVLERIMREEIRDDTLRSIRQNLPNLVSVNFREDEAALITAVVDDLIQVNTFPNEERTRQAQQAAADAVAPEIRAFEQGQTVVRAGTIVTEADMEALTQLGLLQPEDRRFQEFMSGFLLCLLVLLLVIVYVNFFHPRLFHDTPMMIVLGLVFLFTLLGARIMGPARVVQPYLFPNAALGLVFATLAGPQVAIVGVLGLAVLIGAMVSSSFALMTMTALGGVVGVLALRNTERFNSYFIAGLLISLVNIGVVVAFYLDGYPSDPLGALTLVLAGAVNGFLAGVVALAGLYMLSSVLNIPTSLRLMELTQPNQQLLQRLLREAPGTYQHSLQVANLAELAAERIGANALLTRVGALYHDVGKMKAPHFFIENQADGVNPHDGLNDPYKSARIIIDHVEEGDILAREYRLPNRVREFIREHHGTTQPIYFYRKAVEQAGGDESAVDKAAFTYPGPRPRSRETAILMLADGCESTIRARRPRNKQEIADIVEQIFDTRIHENELDDCTLSLKELSAIQRVFVESLQGVFHPRIAYTSQPASTGQLPNAAVPVDSVSPSSKDSASQVETSSQAIRS